jgi:hypothetical protein
MWLRTAAPFFASANPLSLECRGRDLVCPISDLFGSRATAWLMNLLPAARMVLEEVKTWLAADGCGSTPIEFYADEIRFFRPVCQ